MSEPSSVRDLEAASFIRFCREVLTKPEGVTAKCPSASAARSLRKRFYRIRAALPEAERALALQLEASVVGRHFTVRPGGGLLDWTQIPQVQETQDDTVPPAG